MQSIVPTLWSSALQTMSHLKLPFAMTPNTTLNEKFDINAGVAPNNGEMPATVVFTIGNGGHTFQTGVNGIPLTSLVDHSADDAALYNHLPFVLRTVDNDLTPAERAKYALRKLVEIGGVNYYAYYAKRLDLSSVTIGLKKTVTQDGVTTVSEYVTSSANLAPVAPDLANTGTVTTSGTSLSVSAIVPIIFDENDANELFNVAVILYGDKRYAVISEFGFCTGVDRTVSINTPAGAVNFNEIIACQIATFYSCHYEMVFNSRGFDFRLELGAATPLLGAENLSTATTIPTSV